MTSIPRIETGSMPKPVHKTWPRILYGTAWKKDATAGLARKAVNAGYRAIDTANQPRHYNEHGVGDGVLAAMEDLELKREDLFLQTKFTPVKGHGDRIPYDRHAPLGEQVEQSFQGSLKHLGTGYLDSYLLHAPYDPRRLTDNDWMVWKSLEALQQRGEVKRIGISNAGLHHLQALYEGATIKPMAVQNRCFARAGWDREVRHFCRENNIAYQGFSLLTANPFVLEDTEVLQLAKRHNATPQQIVFAFARQVGMIPLTGTTGEQHMADDLAALEITLEQQAVNRIENLAG